MEVAQLRGRHIRRRVHQEVERLLVHREQRDFAQVLRADQKHDDAVDASGHAAMRRRAVLECAIETAEALFHVLLAEADLLECLDHDVRQLVTDRAGSNFKAVADEIVLVSLDRQRILVFQRVHTALRHGERVVREVELLVVLVPFVEREVDDPCQFETVTIDEVQFFTGARAGVARELVELGRQASHEEAGVAIAEAELVAQRFGAFLANVLGNRAGAFKLVAFLAPEDIAEARLALTLRP